MRLLGLLGGRRKDPILGINYNSHQYRFDALWMSPAISQKEDHFRSYHSGYHEVAPSLDVLIICDEICKLECVFLEYKQYQIVITL